jgi:hypothetical protein
VEGNWVEQRLDPLLLTLLPQNFPEKSKTLDRPFGKYRSKLPPQIQNSKICLPPEALPTSWVRVSGLPIVPEEVWRMRWRGYLPTRKNSLMYVEIGEP